MDIHALFVILFSLGFDDLSVGSVLSDAFDAVQCGVDGDVCGHCFAPFQAGGSCVILWVAPWLSWLVSCGLAPLSVGALGGASLFLTVYMIPYGYTYVNTYFEISEIFF